MPSRRDLINQGTCPQRRVLQIFKPKLMQWPWAADTKGPPFRHSPDNSMHKNCKLTVAAANINKPFRIKRNIFFLLSIYLIISKRSMAEGEICTSSCLWSSPQRLLSAQGISIIFSFSDSQRDLSVP